VKITVTLLTVLQWGLKIWDHTKIACFNKYVRENYLIELIHWPCDFLYSQSDVLQLFKSSSCWSVSSGLVHVAPVHKAKDTPNTDILKWNIILFVMEKCTFSLVVTALLGLIVYCYKCYVMAVHMVTLI